MIERGRHWRMGPTAGTSVNALTPLTGGIVSYGLAPAVRGESCQGFHCGKNT